MQTDRFLLDKIFYRDAPGKGQAGIIIITRYAKVGSRDNTNKQRKMLFPNTRGKMLSPRV